MNEWSRLAGSRHGHAGPGVIAEINGCSGKTLGSTSVDCPVVGEGFVVVQQRRRRRPSSPSSCASSKGCFSFFSTPRGSPVLPRIKHSPPFYGPQIFPFRAISFFFFPCSVSETFSRSRRLMFRTSAYPP